ncbi:hypothetical protein [Paenibacillus sp. UNC451MF]|uniref:hypothetical protein n=1 Tax=Paenibacillus sp. UNC451MF TaxID=1449063 RepID=UPI0004914088|nr:hypothetical protein [Paenibacillus sp. UNC451MF]
MLYVAIPHEIHPVHDEMMDICEIRISTDLDIFDLGEFDHDFQEFFKEKNEETKQVKQAYLLTNFIGACCTDIRYHGAKYESGRNDNMKYMNYALFNIEHDQDVIVKRVKTYEPCFTEE